MTEAKEADSQPRPLSELMTSWVSAWVGSDTGPLFSGSLYRSPNYEMLDETRRQAEEPEREAYRQLVSGAASAIALTAKSGDTKKAVEELVSAIPHSLNKSNTAALFRDVFTEALGIMTGPDAEPSTAEVAAVNPVTFEAVELPDEVVTQLRATSDKELGIPGPEVTIARNAWEVSGEPEAAKETLEGLRRLADVFMDAAVHGNQAGLAVHEPEGGDPNTYRAYMYFYAFSLSPEILEGKRQYLARETNKLLTQLQSPYRL